MQANHNQTFPANLNKIKANKIKNSVTLLSVPLYQKPKTPLYQKPKTI